MDQPLIKNLDAKDNTPSWKILTVLFRTMVVDLLTYTNIGFKLYLFLRGAKIPKTLPACNWASVTLQDQEEWHITDQEVRKLGLLTHPSREKHWDALKAVSCILSNLKSDSKILDAGGTLYSTPLIWLYQYGLKNLFAIDLSLKRLKKRGDVRYLPGDLTHTNFTQHFFDAATCLSVLEHGVDLHSFISEMSRLIRPGGYLLVSIDYWNDQINTDGLYAFNAPIHIFHEQEIINFIQLAEAFGFEVLGTKQSILKCKEKAVRWKEAGLDFTFLFLSFRKRD
jgi:2-polyprenyl-3-methyl-5-hydroxy-6-metoxy-1,4-benzoquinol methylase